jgi:hypothetical protein
MDSSPVKFSFFSKEEQMKKNSNGQEVSFTQNKKTKLYLGKDSMRQLK